MSDSDDPGSLTPKQRKALTRVPSDRAMTITLASTGLIAAFMQTLVTPIIPRLPEYLSTTPADASWVLTATVLAAAISTPISGRLGDMYGKRRLLLILLAIMAGGSIIGALSNTLIPMIIGRVLQGIGLGTIALGISVLRDVIHPKNLGGAVALVSATLGVGGAIGLPIAAVIAQYADWHWLFWLATALSVGAIIAVATIVPVSTLRSGGRFDLPGAIGLAIGLVAILLAVSKGSAWGWNSPLVLGLIGGGILVLLVWGAFELRTHDPLVDLRVAARRPVLLTNLTSITVGFSFFVVTAALPIILETPPEAGIGFGLPLILASLCLMPLGLVMFLLSSTAARLSNARGPRTSLILGGIIIAVGFTLAVFFLDQVWHVILVSTITGVGVGFAYAAMPTLIMRSVPPTETAAANGLNSVMRSLGGAVASIAVGIVLASNSTIFNEAIVPTRSGYALAFAMGAGVVLVGVVIALFIPRRSPNYDDTASIPVQRS